MALSSSDNIHNQFSRGFHVNGAVCLYDICFNTISASIIVFSYFSVLSGSARFHYPFLRAHYCIGCARSMCIMYRNLEFHRSRLEKHVTAARTKMVRIILIVKHCLCLMYRTVGLQGIASLQSRAFCRCICSCFSYTCSTAISKCSSCSHTSGTSILCRLFD